MKAIYVTEQGPTSVLKLETIPMPEPSANEVLVKLHAAGLNFIDIYMRRGEARIQAALPFVPGREGAGVVVKVGSNVSHVKEGDRVAFVGSATYAEYCTVNGNQVIPVPDDIDFVTAAAFPLQGMTAQYLLHDFYQVKSSSTVLVHAAAGGVGLLLLQWLRHIGANVIGTVSTEEKAQAARAAGANNVILYSTQDFVEETMKLTNNIGVDYVIDGVGKTTFTKDLDVVKSCGWICIYGSASGAAEPIIPNLFQAKSIIVAGGSLFPRINTRESLLMRANSVLNGMQAGWLNIKIDNVFPLQEAAQAHHVLENRLTSGKVVLKIVE